MRWIGALGEIPPVSNDSRAVVPTLVLVRKRLS